MHTHEIIQALLHSIENLRLHENHISNQDFLAIFQAYYTAVGIPGGGPPIVPAYVNQITGVWDNIMANVDGYEVIAPTQNLFNIAAASPAVNQTLILINIYGVLIENAYMGNFGGNAAMLEIDNFLNSRYNGSPMYFFLTLLFKLIYHIPGPITINPLEGLTPAQMESFGQFLMRLREMHVRTNQITAGANNTHPNILLNLLELYNRSQVGYIETVMQRQLSMKALLLFITAGAVAAGFLIFPSVATTLAQAAHTTGLAVLTNPAVVAPVIGVTAAIIIPEVVDILPNSANIIVEIPPAPVIESTSDSESKALEDQELVKIDDISEKTKKEHRNDKDFGGDQSRPPSPGNSNPFAAA